MSAYSLNEVTGTRQRCAVLSQGRQEEDGSLTREWFGAERKAGAFYEPLEGRFATFEGALDRVVFYGVMQ